MNVIILGCGRVGSALARLMFADGHNVTIIDQVSEAFRRLGPKFKGSRVVGNGLDEDVLKRAGLENCDLFVSVTQGDNRNIMAAQIAHEIYSVKQVVCRINDPIRALTYRELGILTLCGTTLLSGLVRDYVTNGEWPTQDYNEEYLARDV